MMNKKDLDKLFQEKLTNFSETPDEKVWNSIEASLNQKKKSRLIVLPIWWKIGGAAALIAVLFYLVNPFEKTLDSDVIITDIESSTELNQNSDSNEGDQSKSRGIQENEDSKEAIEAGKVVNNTEEASKEENGGIQNGTESKPYKVQRNSANTGVNVANKLVPVKSDVAVNKDNNTASKTGVNNDINKLKIAESIEKDTQKPALAEETSAIAAVDEVNSPDRNNRLESNDDLPENNEVSLVENDQETDKKSIFDEIAKKEKEEEAQGAMRDGKWAVGPLVAPVYFDSFGEGSPIHSNFAPNSKSGTLNLSYGLSVSYEISKKLQIRSGIHKVDYGYNTNDISFSSSLAASTNGQIDNIDYATSSKNLVVQSSAEGTTANDTFINPAEFAAPDPSRNGRMVQQFGYLEVPLELNFALVDTRLGVELIGGMSSLFLVDNSVTLESDGSAMEIGEANNINDINFSTNVGVGINYKVTDKMQVNLEPMFKYQLNTFSDTAGSFQPFSVGVYSGLTFRF